MLKAQSSKRLKLKAESSKKNKNTVHSSKVKANKIILITATYRHTCHFGTLHIEHMLLEAFFKNYVCHSKKIY